MQAFSVIAVSMCYSSDSSTPLTLAEGLCYRTLGVEFQCQIEWERPIAVIVGSAGSGLIILLLL